MNKLFKIHWLAALCGLTMLSLTACNDDDNPENKSPEVNPDINVNVETYAGGELGTTFNNSASAYEDPTPATTNSNMGNISLNVLIRRIPNLSMVWDRFISAIHV